MIGPGFDKNEFKSKGKRLTSRTNISFKLYGNHSRKVIRKKIRPIRITQDQYKVVLDMLKTIFFRSTVFKKLILRL